MTLPYLGTAGKPDRLELALLQVVGSNVHADKFDAIAINGGMIELRGLAAGDYDLVLKQTGEKVRIRIADAVETGGYLLNHVRQLQEPGLKPVQIEAISADDKTVTVKLRDASKFTRVHVFAGRYLPAFSAFNDLSKVRDAELEAGAPLNAECVYLTGRNIGDEYRYVLERRNQRKFAGNMLERPGFLLNPWAVRTTETGEQMAQAGDRFGARGGGIAAGTPPATPEPGTPPPWNAPAIADFAELDFLYDASAVAVNLVPDENGIIQLPRKDIGTNAFVHVAAIDPLNTTYRKQVERYFTQLRAAFVELQRAYPHLLAEVERLLLKSFGEQAPLGKARKAIEHHARLVLNVAVDTKLKAFLLRVSDEGVEDTTWLESVATLLVGKPPVHWDDQDRARFEVQLAATARTFEHYRVLAIEMEKTGYALLDGDKSMLLVSITVPDRGEVEKVVQVPPELSPQARIVREEFRRVLQEQNLLDRKDVSVAIIAELVRQLLSENEKPTA